MKNQNLYLEEMDYKVKKLIELINSGKINISNNIQLINDLNQIKFNSKGVVELATINRSVKPLLILVDQILIKEIKEELNKISMNEIQKKYFDIIEKNFGEIYRNKINQEDENIAAFADFISQENIIKESNIENFIEEIKIFWETYGEKAINESRNISGFKGVYGGDLFPVYNENIISKSGVYIDTIILPDPFIRSLHIFDERNKNNSEKVFYFLKHGLNLMKYKEACSCDLEVPIAIILPEYTELNPVEKNFIEDKSKEDSLLYAKEIFKIDFKDFNDLLSFSKSNESIEDLCKHIKNEKFILFDTNWKGNIKDQIERSMNQSPAKLGGTSLNAGLHVLQSYYGRMATLNELILKSNIYNATPIFDAPTSWKYMENKLESSLYSNDEIIKLRAMQESAVDLEFIGDVPLDSLIEIRKENAIPEIRGIITKNLPEILSQDISNDVLNNKKKMIENVKEDLLNHQKNLKEIKNKKYKFAGKTIGSFVVKGGISIAAGPILGDVIGTLVGGVLSEYIPGTGLKEAPQEYKKIKKENIKIKNSASGILFNLKSKSKKK